MLLNQQQKLNRIVELRKIFLIILLLLGITAVSFTHGVDYSIKKSTSYKIKFEYEGGIAMSNATVLFFIPGNYDNPGFKKKTNNKGEVEFSPDKKGEWIIIAKQKNGHAKRVNLTVGDVSSKSIKGSLSMIQKIIMGICVIWGFIGLALFYKSRNMGAKK